MLFGIILSSFSVQTNASPKEDSTPSLGEALQRILFIGNSYFYYNDSLHNHVKRLALTANSQYKNSDLKFRSITISGGRIKNHPLEHYLNTETSDKKSFDFVILQGHSTSALK